MVQYQTQLTNLQSFLDTKKGKSINMAFLFNDIIPISAIFAKISKHYLHTTLKHSLFREAKN